MFEASMPTPKHVMQSTTSRVGSMFALRSIVPPSAPSSRWGIISKSKRIFGSCLRSKKDCPLEEPRRHGFGASGQGELRMRQKMTNHSVMIQVLWLEWCRSRAHVMRFAEEVELLNEERQRVIRFLAWKKEFWISRSNYWLNTAGGSTLTPLIEGLIAYAKYQAHIQASLAEHFLRIWEPIPQFNSHARQRVLEAHKAVGP
ncbi:hypothetical protein H0H92_005000 [Tricholoma furcatifolium]|nr:hypothetical protein H0H92_005000 [Tricholoma furcatifolium]